MKGTEILRYKNTVNDLLNLGVNDYCDLGPGRGEIAVALKNKGNNICWLEAPWDFEDRTNWSKDYEINVLRVSFFLLHFKKLLIKMFNVFL